MEIATEVFADENRTVEREFTVEEIKQREADAIAYAQAKADEEQIAAEKAEAKSALLERLGITAEEAALLLG